MKRMDTRGRTRKLFAVCAVLAVVLGTFARPAQAEVYPNAPRDISELKGTVTIYLDKKTRSSASLEYVADYNKLESVESSNPSVLLAYNYTWQEGKTSHVYLTAQQKTGKATVTLAYEGKTRTIKVNVKKYANPVKSLKIGGKNYSSKFNKTPSLGIKFNKFQGKKISVKAKSGWKVKGIYALTYKKKKYAYKKVKNNGTLPKTTVCAYVEMQNKSTEGVEWLQVVRPA